MLQNLSVDPEFQGKIPPLTFEELNLLEANILEEGRIISPLIVWNGLIVDGHNRFAILKNHPEIEYTVLEKEFANRYEAIVWICKNQLGRRNLTLEQKKYLVGKQYEAEKQIAPFQGNQYTLAQKSGADQIGAVDKYRNRTDKSVSDLLFVEKWQEKRRLEASSHILYHSF